MKITSLASLNWVILYDQFTLPFLYVNIVFFTILNDIITNSNSQVFPSSAAFRKIEVHDLFIYSPSKGSKGYVGMVTYMCHMGYIIMPIPSRGPKKKKGKKWS